MSNIFYYYTVYIDLIDLISNHSVNSAAPVLSRYTLYQIILLNYGVLWCLLLSYLLLLFCFVVVYFMLCYVVLCYFLF